MYRIADRSGPKTTFLFWYNQNLVERPYSAANFGGIGYPAAFSSVEQAEQAILECFLGFSEKELARQASYGYTRETFLDRFSIEKI